MVDLFPFHSSNITHLGYGRNEQEATTNCIKNLFEQLTDDDSKMTLVMQALKKGILSRLDPII